MLKIDSNMFFNWLAFPGKGADPKRVEEQGCRDRETGDQFGG